MDTFFKKMLVELLTLTGHSRQERPVADYILRYCKKLGLKTLEDDTGRKLGGNAGNVLVWAKGADPENANVMFCSHMDSVPVGPERKMKVSQKGINAIGAFPIGLDNRLGVALQLKLLSEVRGGYGCAFTTQEEIGMFGAEAMTVPKPVRTIFVLDGSQAPGHFVSSTVGCVTFKITLDGLAAHAGIHPNAGKSVIQIASKAIASLPLGMPGRNESINIGVFNAGTGSNVVPSHAEIIGDVRANSLDKVDAVVGKVGAVFERYVKMVGGNMKCSRVDMFRPYAHRKKSPIFLRTAAAIMAAGLTPESGLYRGGSDANVFNHKGVPAVNLSIGAHNPHSAQEYLLWEESMQAYRIMNALLAQR